MWIRCVAIALRLRDSNFWHEYSGYSFDRSKRTTWMLLKLLWVFQENQKWEKAKVISIKGIQTLDLLLMFPLRKCRL